MAVEHPVEGERVVDLVALAVGDPALDLRDALRVALGVEVRAQFGDPGDALVFGKVGQARSEETPYRVGIEPLRLAENPGREARAAGWRERVPRHGRFEMGAKLVIGGQRQPLAARRRGRELGERRKQVATVVGERDRAPVIRQDDGTAFVVVEQREAAGFGNVHDRAQTPRGCAEDANGERSRR
jgi:hypothetical protein